MWDEQLAGVVGMAVAAEKRRENVKAGFVVPTQVLRQSWFELQQLGEISTNSQSALSSLTPRKRRHLEEQLEDLQKPYGKVRKKLRKLRSDRAIENDSSAKFKLDEQIKKEQKELDKLELQIEEIEKQLGYNL